LPTELRQLEQKVNFSTSYASRASCPAFFRRLSTVQVVARSATPYCTQLKVDGYFSLPDPPDADARPRRGRFRRQPTRSGSERVLSRGWTPASRIVHEPAAAVPRPPRR